MADPEKDIKLGEWDKEEDLREKADIHRSRLQKYGKSKMNNEMFFLNSKGQVYKYVSGGKKLYV